MFLPGRGVLLSITFSKEKPSEFTITTNICLISGYCAKMSPTPYIIRDSLDVAFFLEFFPFSTSMHLKVRKRPNVLYPTFVFLFCSLAKKSVADRGIERKFPRKSHLAVDWKFYSSRYCLAELLSNSTRDRTLLVLGGQMHFALVTPRKLSIGNRIRKFPNSSRVPTTENEPLLYSSLILPAKKANYIWSPRLIILYYLESDLLSAEMIRKHK